MMNPVLTIQPFATRFGVTTIDQRYKILLVDDEEDHLFANKMALKAKSKQQGFRPQILEANGYEQALKVFQENPDINQVVSDWDYKDPDGRTGWDLAKTLTEQFNFSIQNILLWSGIEREASPFTFLSKVPESTNEIISRMRSFILGEYQKSS